MGCVVARHRELLRSRDREDAARGVDRATDFLACAMAQLERIEPRRARGRRRRAEGLAYIAQGTSTASISPARPPRRRRTLGRAPTGSGHDHRHLVAEALRGAHQTGVLHRDVKAAVEPLRRPGRASSRRLHRRPAPSPGTKNGTARCRWSALRGPRRPRIDGACWLTSTRSTGYYDLYRRSPPLQAIADNILARKPAMFPTTSAEEDPHSQRARVHARHGPRAARATLEQPLRHFGALSRRLAPRACAACSSGAAASSSAMRIVVEQGDVADVEADAHREQRERPSGMTTASAALRKKGGAAIEKPGARRARRHPRRVRRDPAPGRTARYVLHAVAAWKGVVRSPARRARCSPRS